MTHPPARGVGSSSDRTVGCEPDDLIDRYSQDPGAWPEPLKLWCGAEQDLTEVIKGVATQDLVLKLECLIDAVRVEDPLRREIVTQ